uniref:RecF/RecN/SMC N-terminal domain-containing protein n=1 Tax=Oryctolagus cuniculus TaxID=9986 RepID=A0A5F9CHT7_RABIT
MIFSETIGLFLKQIKRTRIVNQNFKSYAGERILGPFHKHFSCITGPNGSGKSNVIYSIPTGEGEIKCSLSESVQGGVALWCSRLKP